MEDWTHTKPPYALPVEIFDHYGQVREATRDIAYMRLTDCTYPAQNAIYPADDVVAWRLRSE
jgi:hypothetical protein